MPENLRVDVWMDVVCPWCYIGKRRLETALAGFDHPVEVITHSYQLDPSAPADGTGGTVVEWLGDRYGGGAGAGQQMVQQVEQTAAAEGLEFHHADSPRTNTFDAHRLLHLALSEGGPELQAKLVESLQAAYFTRAQDIADHALLRELAVDAGLDAGRVQDVLASEEYADAVLTDIQQAQAIGANGVPFFVIGGKYGVSGAQPAELFAQALDQARAEQA